MKLYSYLNVSGKHILCLYILSERTGQITRESAIYIINGSFPYITSINTTTLTYVIKYFQFLYPYSLQYMIKKWKRRTLRYLPLCVLVVAFSYTHQFVRQTYFVSLYIVRTNRPNYERVCYIYYQWIISIYIVLP
jgi:hypothetical protein